MNRRLRHPPSQADFDAITFASAPPAPPLPDLRLADARYASQFYVNPKSRLTPISGAFPCVYLGLTQQTAICEVFGDKFHLTRTKKLAVHAIVTKYAQRIRFLKTPLPALNLCNWTDPGMRLSCGIDSSAIMALNFKITRTWAERVARHPADFDGIYYRSRHTDEPCLVLWLRPGGRRLDHELNFSDSGAFLASPDAYAAAARCQVKLAFI
jgi:hypothetical protein